MLTKALSLFRKELPFEQQKYLQFRTELERIMREANAAVKINPAAELMIRREENRLLSEALFRHSRELALMAGETIEPIAWEAHAELFPVGSVIAK